MPTFKEARMTMEATGGCLCGAVRYRVHGPARTSLCHCRSCRLATGGPSLAWAIFDEGNVTFERGAPAIYESSPGVERGFCAQCGTSLTYRRANRPGLFDVTTASLDDPEVFPPSKEIWVSERLSWITHNSSLPQFEQFSTPPS
jgi:hypothetical protein